MVFLSFFVLCVKQITLNHKIYMACLCSFHFRCGLAKPKGMSDHSLNVTLLCGRLCPVSLGFPVWALFVRSCSVSGVESWKCRAPHSNSRIAGLLPQLMSE